LSGKDTSASSQPRVAVIGAGAFGGWTALHLARSGARVTLFDRWGAGNALSSSGGRTRAIRALYGADRIYTEMVKRAFELWDELGAATHEPLYVESSVLWMNRGDDGYVRSAVPILHDLGFAVDALTIEDAAKRYSQIDFRDVKSVWLERKGGSLSARHACAVVRDVFSQTGGQYRAEAVMPGPISNGTMKVPQIEADVYVFACGPWLGRLFPDVIGDRVRPTRQEVYYFATPEGSDRYALHNLPIWLDFGKRIVYGIPDPDGRLFKVADDTRGEEIDPTTEERNPDPEGIERARHFLSERFPEIANAPLMAAEVCQYENSPDGNLIVDRHPEASNVWILGGGSGHGFKLSPVVGEMAAAAILEGTEPPEKFHLSRLANPTKRKTQFD